MPLTVKRLREVLDGLPCDMIVGVRGWFGESHPFSFAPAAETFGHGKESTSVLLFDHIDIGDEPE